MATTYKYLDYAGLQKFARLINDKFTAISSGTGVKVEWDNILDKPTTFSPATHSHSASDITSGKLVIARIPTGTTSATVALGNHTHSYAGSSSAGGAATSANKLNTNAGSNTKPVYFSGGVPVECNDMATQAELNTVKDDLTVVINGKLDAVSAIVATDITWDKLLA